MANVMQDIIAELDLHSKHLQVQTTLWDLILRNKVYVQRDTTVLRELLHQYHAMLEHITHYMVKLHVKHALLAITVMRKD